MEKYAIANLRHTDRKKFIKLDLPGPTQIKSRKRKESFHFSLNTWQGVLSYTSRHSEIKDNAEKTRKA